MPPKSSVLGKRTRSNSSSTDASNCSRSSSSRTVSPAGTPSKRQRTNATEEDGPDANKENIPPLPAPEVPQPPPSSRRAPSGSSHPVPISAITPARRRQLTRNESTPVIELGNLQLQTPPVTPSKPVNNDNAVTITLYAQARALLRTSSSSTSAIGFNGRESERATIVEFFTSGEDDGKSCLYISGTPGTGKTALVNNVLKGLEDKVTSRYTNCVGMRAEEIKELARQARDEKKDKKKPMILVLDELEHVDGEVIPLLNSVATHSFRIVGISNTHTLTTKPNGSTLTMHFKPYTAQEMTDIISKRLATLELPKDTKAVIATPALSFACRKVASQTGDLRACLALVRGAIELAEKEHMNKVFASQGDDAVPLIVATMSHVLAASKVATTQAPGTVSVVRQLNLQARLVLLSLLLANRRLSASLSLTSSSAKTPSKMKGPKEKGKAKAAETLTADALFNFYIRLLSGNEAAFSAVSRSEFVDLLGLLETQGLLERGATVHGKGKKSDKAQAVGVPSASREEEMVNGLTVPEPGALEGPAEREIRTIWTRETSKIKREVEDRELSFKKRRAAFEDAEEA